MNADAAAEQGEQHASGGDGLDQAERARQLVAAIDDMLARLEEPITTPPTPPAA